MTHKQMSSKGGKSGVGASKRRTKAQARAAAMVRWSKVRAAKKGKL